MSRRAQPIEQALTITFTTGTAWANEDYMESYYGISSVESANSDLSTFDAEEGDENQFGSGVLVFYKLETAAFSKRRFEGWAALYVTLGVTKLTILPNFSLRLSIHNVDLIQSVIDCTYKYTIDGRRE
jgi:hypothetical protein